jgi:hypothetical protein
MPQRHTSPEAFIDERIDAAALAEGQQRRKTAKSYVTEGRNQSVFEALIARSTHHELKVVSQNRDRSRWSSGCIH